MGGAFAVEYRLVVLAGCVKFLKLLLAATLGSCDLIHPLSIMMLDESSLDVVASRLSLLKF